MRPWALLVGALVLAGCQGSSAGASCAGATVELSSTTASPGDEVTLTGDNFLTDCYDGGEPGTPPPQQDIGISLAPTAESSPGVPLGTVDADADGHFELTVQVPDDMPTGPALLTAGTAQVGLDVIPR